MKAASQSEADPSRGAFARCFPDAREASSAIVPLPADQNACGASGVGSNGPLYRPLPETFSESGFRHQQLAREGDVALYERQKGSRPHWEVIVVQHHKGAVVQGHRIEPCEAYPSASDWGTSGWTLTELEAVWAKFREVAARQTSKIAN